jgi:uncharacterized damage-inducible protein DinB
MMMEPFFVDYLERLDSLLQGFEEAISGLSPEALNWKPGPEMNSIAVLITHTTGSTRFWIGDVVLGEPSDRVRDNEFRAQAADEAALKTLLANVRTYTHDGLPQLTLADLDAIRQTPDGEAEYTVGWVLLHVMEHVGQHLGHIQLTRQLWEQHQNY